MQLKHEFRSSPSLIVSVYSLSFITYVCLNDRVCACKAKLQRDLSNVHRRSIPRSFCVRGAACAE
jgi:hypothetical protein